MVLPDLLGTVPPIPYTDVVDAEFKAFGMTINGVDDLEMNKTTPLQTASVTWSGAVLLQLDKMTVNARICLVRYGDLWYSVYIKAVKYARVYINKKDLPKQVFLFTHCEAGFPAISAKPCLNL